MITMEDAVNALYTALDSGLEAALAAIETARSCAITRWKKIERYTALGSQFPHLGLIPKTNEIEYGDPDAPIVEGIGMPVIDVLVRVAGTPTKAEASADELSRYAEAIGNVVAADNTLNGAVDWALVAGVEWFGFIDALEDKRLIQSLRVEVQMKKHG